MTATLTNELNWLGYRIERLRQVRELVSDREAGEALDELIEEAEIRLAHLAGAKAEPTLL